MNINACTLKENTALTKGISNTPPPAFVNDSRHTTAQNIRLCCHPLNTTTRQLSSIWIPQSPKIRIAYWV